jgi:glutaconate CoA-transferase subunit A
MDKKLTSLKDAVSLIKDGDSVAIGGTLFERKPMAVIREIIRQKKKNLTLITSTGVIDVDILIGAGCVSKVCASYVGFDAFGFAPNFQRALESGAVKMEEYSEMTIHTAIRGGRAGIPFMPTRGLQGSELLKVNPNYKQIKCPFTGSDLIAVRSAEPDVSIVHLHRSDEYGNVQMGRTQALDFETNVAGAGKKTIVSFEELVSVEETKKRPEDTILQHFEVDAVVHLPHGAHPGSFSVMYPFDTKRLAEYIFAASNVKSFESYLKRYVYSMTQEQYLQAMGLATK